MYAMLLTLTTPLLLPQLHHPTTEWVYIYLVTFLRRMIYPEDDHVKFQKDATFPCSNPYPRTPVPAHKRNTFQTTATQPL